MIFALLLFLSPALAQSEPCTEQIEASLDEQIDRIDNLIERLNALAEVRDDPEPEALEAPEGGAQNAEPEPEPEPEPEKQSVYEASPLPPYVFGATAVDTNEQRIE